MKPVAQNMVSDRPTFERKDTFGTEKSVTGMNYPTDVQATDNEEGIYDVF